MLSTTYVYLRPGHLWLGLSQTLCRYVTFFLILIYHGGAFAYETELAIANTPSGNILYYPLGVDGDVAPIRILTGGTDTRLNGPVSVEFDLIHDEVIITNIFSESVTVFSQAETDGKVPLRVLRGTTTGLSSPTAAIVDAVRDELIVVNGFAQSISFFERTADGDKAPLRLLAGPTTQLAGPRGIALDPVNGELLVTNITTHAITVFRQGASGDEAPLRVIAGPDTGLQGPRGIAVDPIHDEIFVTNITNNSITVYPGSAHGNVVPLRTIAGPATRLSAPVSIVLNTVHDEVVVVGSNTVLVFSRSSSGDVAPVRTLKGPSTGLSGPTFADVVTNPPLFTSVLPASRSVMVGAPATAFATVINAGPGPVAGCAPVMKSSLPATFAFQTTDSGNVPVGTLSTPANIDPGESLTFVFSITPFSPFEPKEIELSFACLNTVPAGVVSGLNTLLLSASDTPIPDMVALVATINNDGIVHIPNTMGTGFFAVASVNVGASDTLMVSVDTGSATLPIVTFICETDPATAVCINPTDPTTGDVTLTIDANATPTFAVFVEGMENIAFDPANKRVFVRFKDAGGVTRGLTSVAVQTD